MTLILITGGNGDCGVEACKQLAKKPEVKKVVITCRSKEKATNTIDDLVAATGKDPSFFGFVTMDLTDYASIIEGVKSCPDKIDRLCLNVGGLGKCELHACGATDQMVLNTLGHALLFDKLVEAGKISKRGRVIYVGSEVSHDIYSFSGLLPHYYGRFSEKDIDWAMSKTYDDMLSKGLPVRKQLGDYKNSKIIGQLHFSNMAKEHPDLHFMTISPGK
jgi:NAD(P)-dependent dehydrogenase (short-subunit alcohol dehydrogenase family)